MEAEYYEVERVVSGLDNPQISQMKNYPVKDVTTPTLNLVGFIHPEICVICGPAAAVQAFLSI
jgi:hypothetical protein